MNDMRISQNGEKQRTNAPRGWAEEWNSTVEAIRDSAGVKKLLKEEWDKTVRPFHRRKANV